MFMVCPVRNIGAVVAPSVTPVAQKGEATGGTGATTGVLGREAVFVTPFRRRASQVAPLRTTFAAFLHGTTYRPVGLSACRNAASRNTPQVGAPFMTPAVRQDETSSGTGATTGVLDREAVFVTPFRRAGVTSGAPTYHVAAFLHGATCRSAGLSACRNAASRNTPQVGAPFMTPAVRQDETTNGTDATARGSDCLSGTSVGTIGKTARATGSS